MGFMDAKLSDQERKVLDYDKYLLTLAGFGKVYSIYNLPCFLLSNTMLIPTIHFSSTLHGQGMV